MSKLAHSEGNHSRSIRRAVLLAVLLIVPNLYFAADRGMSWTAPPSTLSLFYNVVVTMLALLLLNALLKRLAARYALTQSELLIIYVMVSIATAVAGHDEIEIVASIAKHGFQHATLENDWRNLFWPHLPGWLVVTDARTLTNQENGQASIYVLTNWKPWVSPIFWWSLFYVVVIFVGFCISVIFRKQWVEHERLSYPIVHLPYQMSLNGGSVAFFGNRLMWLGFLLAASVDLINGLHFFFPVVPSLPIRTINLHRYFPEKPWSAMGWTPLCFFPFVIGLGYFIPANLSLSLWVFYLFWKAQKIIAGMFGSYNTLNPFTLNYDAESLGAFLSIFIFTVYTARRHLKRVIRSVFQRTGEDSAEPLSYRIACFGLLGGFVFMALFWHFAGLSIWFATLCVSLYVVTIITVARVRAELGPPSHDFYSASRAMVGMIGSRRLHPQNLVVTTLFRGIDRMYRGHPIPHELESLKLCEKANLDGRKMFYVIMLAAIIAGPMAFWAWLSISYRYGGDTGAAYGGEAFRIAEGWLTFRQGPNLEAIWFAVGGFTLTSALMFASRRFIWWPLHPVGFPLAVSWNMEWFWFPILISWTAKTIILKYGGIKGYNRSGYFFFGLILGEFTVGGGLNLMGLLMRRWIYVFWH